MKTIIDQKPIQSYFLRKNIPQDELPNELLIENALKNITNPANRQTRLQQAIELYPHLDFKKRLCILKQTLQESQGQLKTALIASGCFVGVIAIGVFAFIALNRFLQPFKEAALSGRLWIYDRYIGLRLYNMVDWYVDATICYTGLGFFLFLGLFASTTVVIEEITKIKNRFENNLNLKKIDIQEITYAQQIDPDELINEKTDKGHFLDPLNGEIINKDHINRSAYMKVGHHLFTLKSLTKALLKNHLDDGLMKHPIYNRYLLPTEQEEILEHLSLNFGLNKEKILKSFNIYQTPSFKIAMSSVENEAYQKMITARYKEELNQKSPAFRSLSLEQQEEYIAKNKEKTFQTLRLAYLNTDLDPRIRKVVALID